MKIIRNIFHVSSCFYTENNCIITLIYLHRNFHQLPFNFKNFLRIKLYVFNQISPGSQFDAILGLGYFKRTLIHKFVANKYNCYKDQNDTGNNNRQK